MLIKFLQFHLQFCSKEKLNAIHGDKCQSKAAIILLHLLVPQFHLQTKTLETQRISNLFFCEGLYTPTNNGTWHEGNVNMNCKTGTLEKEISIKILD